SVRTSSRRGEILRSTVSPCLAPVSIDELRLRGGVELARGGQVHVLLEVAQGVLQLWASHALDRAERVAPGREAPLDPGQTGAVVVHRTEPAELHPERVPSHAQRPARRLGMDVDLDLRVAVALAPDALPGDLERVGLVLQQHTARVAEDEAQDLLRD